MIRYNRSRRLNESSGWSFDNCKKSVIIDGHHVVFEVRSGPYDSTKYYCYIEVDGRRDNRYGYAGKFRSEDPLDCIKYIESHWRELFDDFDFESDEYLSYDY